MSDRLNQKTYNTVPGRDYTRQADVAQAVDRLVAGLREDGDEPWMFEILGELLERSPETVMPVVQGSIASAEQNLGQDRRSGSSATLLYPIDAAIRVVAARRGLLGDALSARNWDMAKVTYMLENYTDEIIDLAGNSTTSKNLPQRAAHLLWLLDQCPLVLPGQKCAFLEIGASGGLLLDALKEPAKFRAWMSKSGYRADWAAKSDQGNQNAVMGIDIASPSEDWLQAVILDDALRTETAGFIQEFSRSPVFIESAAELGQSELARAFFDQNADALPVIFSCFVFYQLDDETRTRVTEQARSLLRERGGGLLIVSDIAKYRGYPDQAGGCVSWVEDQDGNQVSPAIFLSKATLTDWKEIQ